MCNNTCTETASDKKQGFENHWKYILFLLHTPTTCANRNVIYLTHNQDTVQHNFQPIFRTPSPSIQLHIHFSRQNPKTIQTQTQLRQTLELTKWNIQIKRIFLNSVPTFPILERNNTNTRNNIKSLLFMVLTRTNLLHVQPCVWDII